VTNPSPLQHRSGPVKHERKRMTSATTLDRAEALLRELLPTMPATIRTRAELFLFRQGGRPRTVDRELCRRLRAQGVPVAEIAVRIGCCESNVYRALKTKEE
jgi:hypothetical protein